MASKLINFLNSQSYKADFKEFMESMEKKYGSEILDECGIESQLDVSKMSKDFFKSTTTADISVDANANVSDTSVISHKMEMAKPFQLVNSFYRLYKELKKKRGKEYAEKIIESQINGRIYINDFTGISSSMPYSYYGKTSIIIKQHEGTPYELTEIVTMEDLFDRFAHEAFEDKDMLVIDLTDKGIIIADEQNKFVKLQKVMKHKSHCDLLKIETKNGKCTIVTEDHPVILDDNTEKEAKNVKLGDKIKEDVIQVMIEDSFNFNNLSYIVGFAIGDGFLVGDYQIGITQKNLKSKKIFSAINEAFPDNWGRIKSGNVEDIFFGNKQLQSSLFNIGRGCENKKLPTQILSSKDKGSLLSLVAGLIDSDGCVNPKSGVIDIRVTSFALVQQVAEIVRQLGFERVRTSFIDKNGNSGFRGTKDLYRVSFVCPNHYQILSEFSEKVAKYKDKVFRERQKDGRFNTNEVHKILPFKQEYVYDITTETGHFYSQGFIQHNCFNYSTFDTAVMGIPGKFDGRGGSKPPKNLLSFLGQIELFSLVAGNSTLGATGLADLLIVMSVFIDKILRTGKDAHVQYQIPETEIVAFAKTFCNDLRDTKQFSEEQLEIIERCICIKNRWANINLSSEENCWNYVEALLTGFIYRLNQPYRGSQSLFSNVSVYDKYFLESLLPSYVLEVDGEMYAARMETVQKLQEIYIKIMNSELARKPITFPVTTACFSIDEEHNILDEEFLNFIALNNLKFGFINMYSGKSSTLSSCCRLRSERDNEYFNSFGSGSTKIGSLGVCTANLPQLAFKIKDLPEAKEFFLEKVKELVKDCQEVNQAKRSIIDRTIKTGAQPLYSLGYMDIKKQYSTVGIVGLYEALEILGMNIKTPEGEEFALKLMEEVNNVNKDMQARFKAPHNCEQIPAENVAVKLAKKDKVLGYNNKYALYSNQFIPLIERTNMLDRIEAQGKFDSQFSGGAICHLNMDQEIKEVETMKNLIRTCAKRKVVYFAINYCIQECEEGHMSVGNIEVCPICGKPITAKYTRVVGFLTKVDSWNKTRREVDFPNRQFYGGINI